MKKQFVITILFILMFWLRGSGNGIDSSRYELNGLLQERKLKFEVYTSSLEKRTGFFGNKTKKDIAHSNEILIEIAKLDNRIISTLNRVIDFRNFEKTNFNYDNAEHKEHLNNLLTATDTLNKQVKFLAVKNYELQTKNQKLKYLFYVLSILPTIILLFVFRKKIIHRI